MTITATTTNEKVTSRTNSNIISKYMDAMQMEINPSQKYKDLTFGIMAKLSRYDKDRPFKKMKRDNIITYLNDIRKTDD